MIKYAALLACITIICLNLAVPHLLNHECNHIGCSVCAEIQNIQSNTIDNATLIVTVSILAVIATLCLAIFLAKIFTLTAFKVRLNE
jgi:hypothetical protein